MRPKKKVVAVPRQITPKGPATQIPERLCRTPDNPVASRDPVNNIPTGYTVNNGLLLKRKILAERARDQIRFPIIKRSAAVIAGISLAVFAVGAYLLYSALPTRPDLVLGIILVSLAGNAVMNNR